MIILANSCQGRYMAAMATMNISLPDDLKNFVDAQVAGRYSTSSEYVRELIRREQDRLVFDGLPAELSRRPKNYTFSVIFPADAGAEGSLKFVLFADGREIPVIVSRDAMDAYAAKMKIRIENLAHGYAEFLEMYQPEFAAAAAQRMRWIETVAIDSAEGVGS